MVAFSLWLAVSVGLADGPSAQAPAISSESFRTLFESARDGNLDVPPSVARNARRFRYVFVGGFGGAGVSGYFSENARELRERGVPRKHIHFVFPSSRETSEENEAAVRDRLEAIAAEGPSAWW